MISVIIPTNRVGGLDVVFDSLETQVDRDFELVLVDNLYRYRRELVAEKAKAYSFPVTHIEPRDNPFPRVCYCRTMNTGVAHARGSILLYQCDYTWMSPECLAWHSKWQEMFRGPVAVDMAYTSLPQLMSGFPAGRFLHKVDPTAANAVEFMQSTNEATADYVDCLDRGKLDQFLWSIFAERLTYERVWSLPIESVHYKNTSAGVFDDYNYCAFKNESFPTDLVLDMNGHDEDYDLSHAWQDSEFSYRLRERGVKWHCGCRCTGETRCINPRSILSVKRIEQPFLWNKLLCDVLKPAAEKMPVNPGFSLREMRERRAA